MLRMILAAAWIASVCSGVACASRYAEIGGTYPGNR